MLKVHFLNVGHGDCTIIEHSNGNLTVIDINNAKNLDITTQQELSLFSQFSFPNNQNKYEINRQRYTSYDSITAVKLMKPQYTIVSVGKKPETDASNKYRQYSDHVWSTRWRGNITLEIDTNGQANIDSEYDR
ncbi:MAG: hypothetical protein QNJ33_01680 [Crocosphaera sp.]|nr:hypothetical protein [Crocosphaera sp.]